MAFADVPKIEKFKFYIDVAFKRAQKVEVKDPKKKQLSKLDTIRDTLIVSLERILNKFPQIDELDDFYKELFKNSVDYIGIKKALGSLIWAMNKVKFFHRQYSFKIRRAEEGRMNLVRREFYGRVNSVLKQIRDELALLEEARKEILKFPVVKTGMKTCCLIGFPNVGKTTLLFKLTGSKPDIQPYAFTTKGVNVSYMERLQLLDTPGTLNRTDKMNRIEMISFLASKYLADFFVFVFDPTYDYVDQEKLYKKVKKFDKEVLVYLSKTDMVENVDEFQKFKPLTQEQLKKELEKKINTSEIKGIKRNKL